jgi:segregation and condensation protein A
MKRHTVEHEQVPRAEIRPLPVKIRGQTMHEIPRDLYIPPDALEILLDTFQGPLDLLLYLIRKHNLEVLDIPMAELTRQYMAYVRMMRAHQLELAAEYLLMAAVLIEIKSRMLLPRPVVKAEEDADPRAELVRRLLEYEKIKLAAQRINDLPQAERDFARVQVWSDPSPAKTPPEVGVNDLCNAWFALLARSQANRSHQVRRQQLSVRERMALILGRFDGTAFIEFHQLLGPASTTPEIIVTFLALLELVRENRAEISQPGIFGPIYVKPVNFYAPA